MSVTVFSGGAGCGKTHQLMLRLAETISAEPLGEGQRVLALTFMHGARRRLDDRLTEVQGLHRRYECTTLDSFAARIVRRWQSLAVSLGNVIPKDTEYDDVVEVAAALLAQPVVVSWVKATFPILVIDEAQDLTHLRLNVVKSLVTELTALIAADEFQCLNENLRPNPAWEWLRNQSDHLVLERSRRTNVDALLVAAAAIRDGKSVPCGKGFTVRNTANASLAGTFLSNQIGWNKNRRSFAVVTPTIKSFSENVVAWTAMRTTKAGNGPYRLQWERSEMRLAEAVSERIQVPDMATPDQTLEAVREMDDPILTREIAAWLDRQVRTKNEVSICKQALTEKIQSIYANQRRYQRSFDHGLKAMSVHGAKNREFDHVVVIWPAAVSGDDEHRRRLLYNAITRAKRDCLVLVQAKNHLNQPPFK